MLLHFKGQAFACFVVLNQPGTQCYASLGVCFPQDGIPAIKFDSAYGSIGRAFA